MTTTKLPAHLHDAYEWTDAAGELVELAYLDGAALDTYVDESAANAIQSDDYTVTPEALIELAAWLRKNEPRDEEPASQYDHAADLAIMERCGK